MQRLILTLISLMLVVAPVSAQAIPTLQPGVVTEVADAAQTLGTINVIQLLIVVGTVALGAFSAWKIIPPLITAVTSAQQQLVAMQVQMASVMERMMVQTGKMESSEQAAEARKSVAKLINAHTDGAIKPAVEGLNKVAETLEELKRDVVTKQVLTETIDPLVKKIDAALQVIHDMQLASAPVPPHDAPPAPAPETAPAESGTLTTNEEA